MLRPQIELKHLLYAEAAGRFGSFRKAADSLLIKQFNLSRRIRGYRGHAWGPAPRSDQRRVQATSAGRDFISGARRVLDDLQAIVDSAKGVGRGEAGYLTIGFYTSLSAGNLRATLVELAQRFPRIEIRTVEASRAQLLGGVANGGIDIAVVTGEQAPNDEYSMAFWSERIIVALPENHPLATNEIIYWTDLKRERFLVTERNSCPEIQDLLTKLASPGINRMSSRMT